MVEGLYYFLKLPEKAQEIYWQNKDAFCEVNNAGRIYNRLNLCLGNDFELLEDCESPIEKIMVIALCVEECHRNFYDKYCFGTCIIPQVPLLKYRVDIDIEIADIENGDTKDLIIECDGHAFHEKTKEQVNKNNQRDYDLKNAGYDILHFSGSEIYNNPMGCAKKVFDYIERGINEKR